MNDFRKDINLNFQNDFQNILDCFSIGLIILTKENSKEYKIKNVNSYANKLLDLPKKLGINVLKEKIRYFKIWENNQLNDVSLEKIIFDDNYSSKFNVGTFVSSFSMIYVKIKKKNNNIYICIDNYSDERKKIQQNLVKSINYQYVVTLYHELHNPLNALQNIIDENNNEDENNKEILIENQKKNNEINLLIHLIKIFLNNFVWYFRINFEVSCSIEVQLNININLEYQFHKILNQFSVLFNYKEINFPKDLSFLNDKFMETNEHYLNNFLRGIFLFLYNKIPKKKEFIIKHSIKPENKLKLIFKMKEEFQNDESRKNNIINDIDLSFKEEFDFSKTVQTEEIIKELLITMAKILNIKLKIHEDEEDRIISMIIPFTIEKEEIENLEECTKEQKYNTIDAVTRKVITNINENNSSFSNNHNFIDNNSYNISINSLTKEENKRKLDYISIFNDSLVKENKLPVLYFKKNEDTIISSISEISNIKTIRSKAQNETLNNERNNQNRKTFLTVEKKRNKIFNNEIEQNINEISLFYNKMKSIGNEKLLNESSKDEIQTRISTSEKKCNCTNILLCDDEKFNLNAIQNMLKKYKINCDLCNNGKECIESILTKKKLACGCKYNNYKLIFLDIMMPVMNGLEAAKKIQELIDKNEINHNLKIIIVSAHIEENLIKQLKNIKCVIEEVKKPLKKCKLEELLNNYYY